MLPFDGKIIVPRNDFLKDRNAPLPPAEIAFFNLIKNRSSPIFSYARAHNPIFSLDCQRNLAL